ncbi:cyclic AMP receptor-like protein A [Acipenser oxyrinchus oxyrinchus]|uniref:Cyclic AMP receptor-like protein A n=1 Tax=Acipenser oxyrinchus oxyrinchus TaxID=40147 RepID=A0AAD8G8N7_ACIOX|nr:cyclic AMP receptor-like protein A [Acipenser oxyrinchus oxyrinchus]
MDNQNFVYDKNNTRCPLFLTNSDDYKCVLIIQVKRVTATFSLISCFFMLCVIWLFRKYNSLAQKMILCLTIAAFFDSIAYVMGDVHPDGVLCNFQAWWLTYFDWCSLAWVCLITLNLYLNLVKEMKTDRFEVLYHLMAWGVPFVMSCLPLFRDYYGPAGVWCWITDDHVAWRFGIWYIPLFTLIFLMTLCYGRIIYVAKERVLSWSGTFNPEREWRKVSLAEEIKPLKWYPSVYLLVSLFPLINRLHNAFNPLHPVFSLTLLHVISAPLHGLANAFVFGLDKDTWGQLNFTSIQLAIHSRLCDRTLIKEYHTGAVRYMPPAEAGSLELGDDDDDDTTVLFYSPAMTLKDRGP